MATPSETRIMVAPTFSKTIVDLLETEATNAGLPQTALIRQIIKWHAGKSGGRYEKADKVKLPKRISKKLIKKSFLVDIEDAEHLDTISDRTGLPRVTALLLIIFAWFDLDPAPRQE